jgi:LacI family transcriptional regulator
MFRHGKADRKKKISHIFLDNTDVGRIAADLFTSSGFTSFAYINTPSMQIWSEERAEAFRSALPEASPFRVWPEDGFSDLAKWLADLPKHTAILAAEDTVARDAMQICNAIGIAIPKDLAFIGVDNDELLCTSCCTPLTSIEPDFRRSGFMTAKILDDMISKDSTICITERYGVNRIIERASSYNLKQHCDIRINKALSIIHAQSHEHIQVHDVAKAINMSRRSAELMFRNELGSSIGYVIRATRLDTMMKKLKETSISISDICAKSGFQSESYAKRAFKARFGKTMSAFRIQNHVAS